MKNKTFNFLLFISVFLFWLSSAWAEMENIYTDVRFQLYNNSNKFTGELITGEANASKLDRNDPRVDLKNGVVIELYDTDYSVKGDKKPPLKVKITSDSGIFMQAQDKKTKEFQQIVVLDGHVTVTRYAKPERGNSFEQTVDSIVSCDKARWNHNTGILNGYGLVTMKQADNTMQLTGKGMIYEVNSEKDIEQAFTSDSENLSGILEITSDVELIVNQRNSNGRIDRNSRVKVNCSGSGRYDFDNSKMYFADNVVVTRNNMLVKSDFLEVILSDNARRKFAEMVAWCEGERSVHIEGNGDPRNVNSKIGKWLAEAQYARYIESTGEMLLTDERGGKYPVAEMDDVFISDNNISFYIKEERFYATGNHGVVKLKAGLNDYRGDSSGEETETVVRFAENLLFDQIKSVAQFTGDVILTSAGIELETDRLLIDFVQDAIGESSAASVKKATAIGRVELVYQERKAKCEKLEITPNLESRTRPDKRGRVLLDNFVLSGNPVPEIEIAGGGFFQAKKITINRYKKINTGERTIYINATGPGSGALGEVESGLGQDVQDLATIIRFSKKMLYDEAVDRVDLYGEVTATNNDQVLSSDRLLLTLAPVQDSAGKDTEDKEIVRLTAVGHANMHWGTQHCEADKVDRQIKKDGKGQIILVGSKTRHARIWEESGASFQGPWIKAADDGSWIYSSGGGELGMLDRETNEKAMVIYSGDAYYSSSGNKSQAIFSKDVILRRGNMKVTGDKMRAELVSTGEGGSEAAVVDNAAEAGISTATLPKRLKRVTIEGNVIVRQGVRVAFGNKGQVDIGEEGDLMLLAGTKDIPAEVNDNNGFSLFAPKIMIKESAGIVTASGPGEVKLVGDRSAQDAGLDPTLVAASGGTYQLYYDGKILYNQLLNKIRFEKNVRMLQDTLRGRCEQLTVYLNKPPEGLGGSEQSEPIKVENIETYGNVRFESYPSPIQGRDPTNLPGRTVFTRSQEAHYDAKHNVILLTGRDRPAEVLFQELTGGNRLRYLQKADRIWYNTKTKEIKVTGSNQQSMPLPSTGPLRFPDN